MVAVRNFEVKYFSAGSGKCVWISVIEMFRVAGWHQIDDIKE
jgi:hypothetical protein